jgi:uncharacterized membrane protein YcfT
VFQRDTSGAAPGIVGVPAPAASRLAFVDYAKGWCIVLVVMMHSTLGLTERLGTTGWATDFIAFAKPFRMPDFFLIAGLFAMRSLNAPLRTFLDGKVLHFAYFYVLWVSVQLFSKYGALLVGNPVQFGHEYLLALIEPFGTLWFIYVLPLMYVAARLLKPVPLIPALFLAAAIRLLDLQTGWTAIDYFGTYFLFFLIGVRLSEHVIAFASWCTAHSIQTLSALVLWAMANAWAVQEGLASGALSGIAFGLAGALAVVAFSAQLARANLLKGLRYAGHHSLVIYLAFFLPMALTRSVLLKLGWAGNFDCAALAITCAAIVTPLVLHRITPAIGLRFLFVRPASFRLLKEKQPLALRPSLASNG